ncbi:MAG: PaaI family thioesterase [Lachnospiraceae bacterium]|nr:PaaI family thioesterase [Lachnospiraceae bacterium]
MSSNTVDNNNIKNAVVAFLEQSDYIRMLDIELLELDNEHAKGRMPFAKKLTNPYGTMHGGSLYSLADTIAGTLANMSGYAVTTIEGNLHFLEPAHKTTYIYCEAKLKRGGSHIITVDVELTDDNGKLLDCGCYTFFRTDYEFT